MKKFTLPHCATCCTCCRVLRKKRNCIVPNSTAVAGEGRGKCVKWKRCLSRNVNTPKRQPNQTKTHTHTPTHTHTKNTVGNHFLLTAKSTKRFFDFTLFVLLSIVCRSECHFTKAIKPPNQRVEIGDIRSADVKSLNPFEPTNC